MSSRIATFLRGLFRFRLRTLMLAVLVIGVGMGLYVNRVRRQQAAVAAIRQAGGNVYYDYQQTDGYLDVARESRVPDWLRKKLGNDWFHSVVNVNVIYRNDAKGTSKTAPSNDDFLDALAQLPRLEALVMLHGTASDEGLEKISRVRHLKELVLMDAIHVTDRGVAYLPALEDLESLTLSESQITDDSLRALGQLPRLKQLMIQGNQLTNEGLKHVGQLRGLEGLWVCRLDGKRNLSITDEGLVHLRGLDRLQQLGLQGTGVTDAGMDHLAVLKELKDVFVGGTDVRDAGRLQSAVPDCVIHGVAAKP